MALLWQVKLSLRKKLALGSVLCLSILAIVISILKVVAAGLINGQVDSVWGIFIWGIFWLQVEASVAVMAVSFTIFRSLFLSETQKASKKLNHKPTLRHIPTPLLETEISSDVLPSVPPTSYSGMSSSLREDINSKDDQWRSTPMDETDFPFQGSLIKVTRECTVRSDHVSF